MKTHPIKNSILRMLVICVSLTLLTSCEKVSSLCKWKPWIKLPCCIDGRRPQVFTVEHDTIVDFDDCDPGCDECEEEEMGPEENCGMRPEPHAEIPAFTHPEVLERHAERDLEHQEAQFHFGKRPPQEFHPDYFSPYAQKQEEYHLVKGDVLEIGVVGDQDTVVPNVIVAPDGRIYYLFLEGIPAEGRTISAVRKDAEAKLAEFFTNPIVAVVPKSISNQTYVILGRVQKPGVYPISYPVRLRDAVGQAGGIYVEIYNQINLQGGRGRGGSITASSQIRSKPSDLSKAFVVRDGQRLNIDISRLVYGGDETQNIFIRPGDYIYLAGPEKRQIYVLGAVASPNVVPFADRMTVISTLAALGGWPANSPYGADIHRVLVIRGSLECPRVMQVDVKMILDGAARDVFLCPGDILYVQNKPFRFGRELVLLAITSYLSSFGSTFAGDIAQNHFFPGEFD